MKWLKCCAVLRLQGLCCLEKREERAYEIVMNKHRVPGHQPMVDG